MPQRFLLACSLLFCTVCSFSQNNVDSLKRIIQANRPDSNNAKALIALAGIYNNRFPDSALYFSKKVLDQFKDKQSTTYVLQANMLSGHAYYIKSEYNNAATAYGKMYALAEAINDKKNMAAALNNQGNVLIEQAELTQAIGKYKQAITIAEPIKDEMGVARSYNNIGFVYKEMGEYEKAIENFLFALKYYEKVANPRLVAMSYNNVAAIYVRQKRFEKALEYNFMALNIQKKNNEQSGKGISLQSIGNIYAENKDYEKALVYYAQALDNYRMRQDRRQVAILYSNIGNMYNLQKNYDSSIAYYDKAIPLLKQMGNNNNLAIAFLGNAASFINLNEFTKASMLLDSAEAVIEITKRKEDWKNYFLVKADFYEATSDFKSSLDYRKKYMAQKDSLFNDNNTKVIADLSVKYETEKKQLQIELLEKNSSIKDLEIKNQRLALTRRAYELATQQLELANATIVISTSQLEIKGQQEVILKNRLDSVEAQKRLYELNQQANIQQLELKNEKLLNARKNSFIIIIIVVALFSGLLAYSYYRRYKLKEAARLQASILQQQQLATKAVMEAEDKERKRIASDLHDGVGQLMSAARMNLSAYESDIADASAEQKEALNKVLLMIDDSLKEVRAVSHNMMPNALLKAGLASAIREFISQVDKRKLNIQLHTEGLNTRLDGNVESVLYRIIQECVTNVIKHAAASQLDISLIRTDEAIEATIEDNGVGFDTANGLHSNGIGLQNIRSRIEFLKGEVEWSSFAQKGTLVAFHVPLVQYN